MSVEFAASSSSPGARLAGGDSERAAAVCDRFLRRRCVRDGRAAARCLDSAPATRAACERVAGSPEWIGVTALGTLTPVFLRGAAHGLKGNRQLELHGDVPHVEAIRVRRRGWEWRWCEFNS